MFCPHCGSSLKDGARFCTSCGQPVSAPTAADQPVPPVQPQQAAPQQTWNQPQAAPRQTWQPQPQQTWNTQQQGWSQQQTWNQQQPSWDQPQQQTWNQPQQQTWNQQQSWSQQPVPPVKAKSKGKKLAAIFIPIGAVAVIAALVAVFWTPISNFFRRNVSSPESYYQYVEKRASDRVASDVGDYYDILVPEEADVTDRSFDAELGVTLGDALRELQNEDTEFDLSWFKDARVHVSGAVGEQLANTDVELFLNGTEVITANGIMDFDASDLFTRIPLFSDDYFRIPLEEFKDRLPFDPTDIDLGNLNLGELGDMLNLDLDDLELEQSLSLQQLASALPSDAEVSKLIEKYYNLASAQIENVEKGEQTISAEGVEQTCMTLTATIDEETMKKIVTEVFNELKKDADVKNIILNLGEKLGEMSGEDDPKAFAEEGYQEFLNMIDDTLENMDESAGSGSMEEITHVVFLDDAGDTAGRVITMGDTVIEYLHPKDGEKFGLRLNVVSSQADFTVTGGGTDRGGVITGKFSVTNEGSEIGTLEVENFDKDALKKNGDLKGTFTLYPSAELLQRGSMQFPIPNLGVRVEADCTRDNYDLKLTVLQNQDVYLAFSLKLALGHESPKTKAPANAMDLDEWTRQTDSEQAMQALQKALEKAGAPADLLGSMVGIASSAMNGGYDYYD